MKKINRTALLFVLFLGMMTQTIFASPDKIDTLEDVEIFVSFPYHEKLHFHDANWTKMQIEIVNHRQDVIKGQLQLFKRQGQPQSENLMMEEQVEISAQENSTFFFSLPVPFLNERPLIRLLTDDHKEVFFQLKEMQSKQGMVNLSIISEEGSDFHFLKSLENEYFRFPSARFVSPNELPQEFWLYHENMIAMGHLEDDRLTAEQVTALEKWVKAGGVLIVSGGESFLQYADDFSDLLPLTNLRMNNVSNREALLDVLDLEQVPLEIPPILVGDRKENVSFFPNTQTPLFSSHRVGNGIVIFAAYDVSAEPMASWQGNKVMWDTVLEKFAAYYTMQKKENHNNELTRLVHLSEHIPNLQSPSVGMITIVWIIYLLIVGPILYIFLKKWDKREWAWVIIPCIVLLTSVSVYMLGLQRIANQSSSNVVSTIQIYDQELARIDSNASFFVLEGKSFNVNVAHSFEAIAMDRVNQQNTMKSFLSLNKGERYLRYENVPYMSLAQAKSMGYTEGIGQMEHDLYVEENRLKGTLTNKTPLDLEQVELQIGQQSYKIGTLAKNERQEVNINLAKFYYTEYKYDESTVAKPFMETRTNMARSMIPSFYTPSEPIIDLYALSHAPIEGLRLEGQGVKEHFTHMIRQELALQPKADQKVVYPYGTLPVYMGQNQYSTGEYFYGESVLTSGGSIPLELQVQPFNLDVHKIQIPIHEVAFSPFSIKIWNVVNKDWEEVEQSHVLELTGAEMTNYVTSRGTLTLLFENNKKENFQLPFPYVMVKGEWKS